MQSQQDPKKSILIVGLGPTGLAATLEACKSDSKKRPVVAVTDRVQYDRNIIFRLDEQIIPYLEHLVGSPRLEAYKAKDLIGPRQIAADNQPYHTIRIGALEQLLYSALEDEKNVRIITTPKRQASQITSIDKCNRTYTLSHTQPSTTISFEQLIAADGYNHGTADRIPDHGIEYECTQQTVRFTKHARVNYKLPADSKTQHYDTFLQQGADKKPSSLELFRLEWRNFSHPEARLFVNDGVFYIGAECPNTFDSKTPAKQIDEWLRMVLRFHLPEAAIKALITTECAVFEVSLREATRTVSFCSPRKHTEMTNSDFDESALFLQLGDALRAPHYQTGSGAVVGLQQAAAYGEFLKTAQTLEDLTQYHAKIAEIRAVNRVRVDTFLEKRSAREQKARNDAMLLMPRLKPSMNMFDYLQETLIEIFGHRADAKKDAIESGANPAHGSRSNQASNATTIATGSAGALASTIGVSIAKANIQPRSPMQFFHFNAGMNTAPVASNPVAQSATKKTKVTARKLYLQRTPATTAVGNTEEQPSSRLTFKFL
jgi:2-polyprenyl-6-methoxyphenol hydroxylase-like FAD-dependent oxidoreductase